MILTGIAAVERLSPPPPGHLQVIDCGSFHPREKAYGDKGAKMKFVVGVVVGLILGSIVPAMASYYNNFEMSQQSRQFQLGYAAGSFDMLQAVDYFAGQHGAAKAAQWAHSQLACLRNDGAVLGDLTDWAVRQWATETGRYSASSILLDNACGP